LPTRCLIGAAFALTALTACTSARDAPRDASLRVAMRAEPQSFNWYTRHDASTEVVTLLTQSRLVRVNRASQEVEPWLAERWTRSADGREYVLTLREGVAFSDGRPLTSADVVFSFRAAYDREAGSIMGDSLLAGGQPLEVSAPTPGTVRIVFAQPSGPGLRLLDNLPILPRHVLEPVLNSGGFASAWSLTTPIEQVVGLGPFVLAEYLPGQRLTFSRNPHYFRSTADGVRLPYLDRIVVDIVPEQDAQLLRLEAGQIDLTTSEVRPEDYAPLRRAADAGRVQLLDLGVGYDPDSFWINLKPGAFRDDPRRDWIQRDELRRAISLAVDRRAFNDTVYLGAGLPVFGPVTPANRVWYSPALPETPFDPAAARKLLASIGLIDRDGNGTLEDGGGHPARFSLITQKGQTVLERGAAVIRDDLKQIGVTVDVTSLEGNAVVQRFLSGQGYDAVYFRVTTSDTDPALNPDYWLSSGGARIWNRAQPTPATDWERRIDELMRAQSAAADRAERKRLFDEVQAIYAEHLPVVHFAAPKVFVAASTRVTNLTPAIARPQLLWAADTIAVN
jgi:peptide/nickel transport system substrate-binding protein